MSSSPPQPPSTCRAWEIVACGLPGDVLRLRDTHAVPPKSSDGMLLVKVEAAGLNPVDWKLMSVFPNWLCKRNRVPGADYSGNVVLSGSVRNSFQPNDRVYGLVGVPLNTPLRGLGTLTQYAWVPAKSCAKWPPNWTAEQLGGIALVGLTAVTMAQHLPVVKHSRDATATCQTVLVVGGSTSVGLCLIPILRNMGYAVVATASGSKCDIVAQRGANKVIDYRRTDVVHELKQLCSPAAANRMFFSIMDCVDMPDVYRNCESFLHPHGTYYTIGADLASGRATFVWRMLSAVVRPRILGGVGRKYKIVILKDDCATMRTLHDYLANGTLVPIIDSIFTFEQVPEAYARLMSNRALGKVIVRI